MHTLILEHVILDMAKLDYLFEKDVAFKYN